MNPSKVDTILLAACFGVASLQPVGFVLDNPEIRGLGIISTASPLPFVFSAHDGLETFAQSYAVELIEPNTSIDQQTRISVDARLYSRLSGAYNLRNAYGAIFSHGPILAQNNGELVERVAIFAFCDQGPLLQTFAPERSPERVILESKPHHPQQPVWRYELRCP